MFKMSRVWNLLVHLGQTSEAPGEVTGASFDRVLLGKKLSEACDTLPLSLRSLPFSTHAHQPGLQLPAPR